VKLGVVPLVDLLSFDRRRFRTTVGKTVESMWQGWEVWQHSPATAARSLLRLRLNYVSLQTDYVRNRNNIALLSTSEGPNSANCFCEPESITQQAFLANVLVHFRRRSSRIRPYVSEGGEWSPILGSPGGRSSRAAGFFLLRGPLGMDQLGGAHRDSVVERQPQSVRQRRRQPRS
jgi:hypothetical protein